MLAVLLSEILKPEGIPEPPEAVRNSINGSVIEYINGKPKFKIYVFYSAFDSFSRNGLHWIQAATDPLVHDVEYVELDYDRRDSSGVAERMKIEYIPTLVLLRDGLEFCRIDRAPSVQLDRAILNCLSERRDEL